MQPAPEEDLIRLGICVLMPDVMLQAMAKTTISVDVKTRDRLAALANRHHRPLGEELAALLDEAERRDFWAEVSAGYQLQPAEPYDAADEFPEYRDMTGPGALPTPPDLADDMSDVTRDRVRG